MTAPMASTGEDPRVEELRRVGRERGYSEAEIQAKLEQAGLAERSTSPLGGMARGLGLAARGAIQGAGNLADMTVNAPQALTSRLMGGGPPPLGQSAPASLPTPQTPGERIGVAAAEGAATAIPMGPAGIAGGMALGAASNAAGQAAKESGMGPMGQAAASLAVGVGVPVVGTLGAAALRSMIAGASSRRLAAQQSAALLRAGDPNAALSLGQITQGGIARTVQGGMRNVPGATEVFKENAATQAQQMQARAGKIADQFSVGGTPASAGAAIQRGIEEGYIPRFKSVAGRLYDRVFTLVPPDTPMVPSHTIKLATDMEALQASARPLSDQVVNPKVMGIVHNLADALEQSPQGVPFNVIKELRSRLGAILSGDELVSDINLRDVRRLYGSLSDDMGDAIAAQGPQATAAWGKAEAFWKQGMDRIERVLQPLADKRVPEAAFTAVMNGSREGASILQGTMRSLGPQEKDLVRATVIRRLGVANPAMQDAAGDVFSPETFLTRWNSIAPEARVALFDGANPKAVGDLNTLAKAIQVRKAASGVLPNPSGTAQNTAFFAILNGMAAAGVGAITGNVAATAAAASPLLGGMAANATARMFTSPRMVDWLVKQTRVPFGALAQQAALLAKQSQSWPEDERELAQQVSSTLGGVDWTKVLTAQAIADATQPR